MTEIHDEIAEMIADWFGRSTIDADRDLAQQIIDRVRLADALATNPRPACAADWACPDHGWICDLDYNHDGDHLCQYCPQPLRPGWSNAAKARRGDIGASEAAMRAEVSTSIDDPTEEPHWSNCLAREGGQCTCRRYGVPPSSIGR